MRELPSLNRALLRSAGFQPPDGLVVPDHMRLTLPERAVQFGTGAFLRGFIDAYLDEANARGRFNGRVVAIGSTGSGRDDVLARQDGLYTLVAHGLTSVGPRQESRIVGSVSRAISATHAWQAVLACARNPWLEVIFSNTTEAGIVLDEGDDRRGDPPRSFPGKLARFLYERACTFAFARTKGVIVVPCELIESNGDRLRQIVIALAEQWRLGVAFVRWLETSVTFCNTLVDRIVPGSPSADAEAELALGYDDELLTTCEHYRLFAIEGDAALRARLRFADEASGIIVARDIAPYRQRKVRILNGAHTIMAPVGLLAGCDTVLEAVQHDLVGRFIRRAMLDEIVPALDMPDAEPFARDVLDRFGNPFIRHRLADITLQATMKMQVRVVPSIVQHVERFGRAPQSLAFGFAAHVLFMRGLLQSAWARAGAHVPVDDDGRVLFDLWYGIDDDTDAELSAIARAACADASLWGTNLTRLPGFLDAVTRHLTQMARTGVAAALDAHLGAEVAAS
jgi:tagaturonate reductase